MNTITSVNIKHHENLFHAEYSMKAKSVAVLEKTDIGKCQMTFSTAAHVL